MKSRLKKAALYTVAIIAGLIVFVLIFDNLLMPWYVNSPEVTVPKVVGMNIGNANVLLEEAELTPVIGDTTYDSQFQKDAISLQNPEPGSIVKKGRRVYLVISGGQPKVRMPKVTGISLRDARFKLERLGLAIDEIKQVSSRTPRDVIVEQQFPPGTELTRGDAVDISISIGNRGGNIELPSFIGKTLAEAEAALTELNLKMVVTYRDSDSLLPNTIMDQYPSPGSRVNGGDRIDLYVSRDPEQNN